MPHTQILILGSGPAGYAAGIYTARAGLSTTMLMGPAPGGQLMLTHEIENYPGAPHITGPDLMDSFHEQAKDVGVNLVYEQAEEVGLSGYPFTVTTDTKTVWTADAFIIATGARPRWLGAPGEDKFKGRGISVCATCDGFFYKDKRVAIIGSGNSAAYEAVFLAQVAAHVTIIARNNRLTAEHRLVEQVLNNPKINLLWETEVVAFQGDTKLESIRCRHLPTGTENDMAIDGVFEAIGHIPNTQLFADSLAIDSRGYLVTQKYTGATSRPGVFAAGDCQEVVHRQAIIAAGSGAVAALSAEKFLLAGN